MKLISMTDKQDELDDYVDESRNYERGFKLASKHKDLLKELLQLWMFVPCDKDGNVLEVPIAVYCCNGNDCGCMGKPIDPEPYEYTEALSKMLFEGWELGYSGMNGNFHWVQKDNDNIKIYSSKYQKETIESLIKYSLILTPTAIKQIGL